MSNLIVPKSWFETWRSPREFFRKADECMGQFEPDEILGMTGVQHLFDAYVAGLFARIWNDHRPCEVRLAKGEFPDAQLRHVEETLELEITMADQKDRQMAVEHRRLREMRERGEVATVPIDQDRDKEYALEAVPRVCSQKVKNYLGKEHSDGQVSTNLLIYVNFSTFAGPVLSDEEMIRRTEPWKDNFLSIWLLCGARIFCAWPTQSAMSAQTDPIA